MFPSARLVHELPDGKCPWCDENLPAKRSERKRSTDIIATIEAGLTELWLLDDQKSPLSIPGSDGRDLVQCPTGKVVYKHLFDTGLLAGCVGVKELVDIQSEGVVFFRKHFGGKGIVGFGDVDNASSSPKIYESHDEVGLTWDWHGFNWSETSAALRRK